MPRKYLRITRRCTCVAPDLMEEEKMIQQRFSLNRCIFLQHESRSLWTAAFRYSIFIS